jgi:DNA polymerase-3 subunit gamma/tau
MEEILSGMATQNAGKRTNTLPGPASSSPRASAGPVRPTAPAASSTPSISPFAASNQRRDVASQGFSADFQKLTSGGVLAPEAGFVAASNAVPGNPTEPVTSGALALSEPEEQPPQIVPPLPPAGPPATTAASSGDENTEAIRSAVAQALAAGGHATAATLIEDARWNVEGASVRIEVNAKPTMIRITFNAAAEKLIRQGLAQAGAPSRFMIVPGEGLVTSNGPAKVRAPLGSIEQEARNHPLVVRAQSLFNAEIVTVVDLRT